MILDVRTPEEYLFVDYADMARNIPIGFVKHPWDTDKNEPVFEPGPDFIASAQRQFRVADTLLVMCRYGGRSAAAVNALAKAGFVNAHNISDGMEGDKANGPDSACHGTRMKNDWNNSGAHWTCEVNPEALWISSDQQVGSI